MINNSSAATPGQEVSSVAPHFETRIGKRRWEERRKKAKRESTP